MLTQEQVDAVRKVAQQIDRLATRLNPALRPSHVDYINKADAVLWCDALTKDLRRTLGEED